MRNRTTYYYIMVASFALVLLWQSSTLGEPVRITGNLRNETVQLPSCAPDRSLLVFQGFTMVLTKGGIAHLAVYNDPQTDRAVDYLELYDYEGNLLLAQWVDEFGIIRMAVDRGLLEGNDSGIQRILSLLMEGTPV